MPNRALRRNGNLTNDLSLCSLREKQERTGFPGGVTGVVLGPVFDLIVLSETWFAVVSLFRA